MARHHRQSQVPTIRSSRYSPATAAVRVHARRKYSQRAQRPCSGRSHATCARLLPCQTPYQRPPHRAGPRRQASKRSPFLAWRVVSHGVLTAALASVTALDALMTALGTLVLQTLHCVREGTVVSTGELPYARGQLAAYLCANGSYCRAGAWRERKTSREVLKKRWSARRWWRVHRATSRRSRGRVETGGYGGRRYIFKVAAPERLKHTLTLALYDEHHGGGRGLARHPKLRQGRRRPMHLG